MKLLQVIYIEEKSKWRVSVNNDAGTRRLTLAEEDTKKAATDKADELATEMAEDLGDTEQVEVMILKMDGTLDSRKSY